MELSGARWPGIGGGVGELRRLKVGDGTDIWGPVDRETWERRPTRGLDGSVRMVSTCGGRRSQWAGWAERPDGPQGRPGRNQEKEFLN
jgi:hypothetical protein